MRKHHGRNIFGKIKKGIRKGVHTVADVGKKVGGTVEKIGGAVEKVGDVGEKVAKGIEKAGPALALGAAVMAPEFAVPIAAGVALASESKGGFHALKKGGQATKQGGKKIKQMSIEADDTVSHVNEKMKNALLKAKPDNDNKPNISFHH